MFNPVAIATTITQAEQRVNRFKSKLENRNIHSKIYEYCNAELITEREDGSHLTEYAPSFVSYMISEGVLADNEDKGDDEDFYE